MYNKHLNSEFYRVAKLFKRIHVVDAFDTIIYTPPDFLRNKVTRELLEELIKAFSQPNADYIHSVVNFETRLRKIH